ncbi:MAG: hypothetical protein WBA17_09090 [Saprospiraceae bacterium]
MDGFDVRDRLSLVNDRELDGMNGAIGSVPVEGHDYLRHQFVSEERDIEFAHLRYPLTSLPAALFSLIGGMGSVVRTLGMAGLTFPAGLFLRFFDALSGTAAAVRVLATGHGEAD